MSDWLKETEPMVYRGRIKVPYTWWVGEVGTDFFNALREERRILGRHCPQCDLVFIPPRQNCGRCFSTDLSWRPVGPGGTLVTYTIPAEKQEQHRLDTPFAFGIVKLDGADTGLTHLISGYREGQLKAGLRVEAIFAEKPAGDIMDIAYFQPIAS